MNYNNHSIAEEAQSSKFSLFEEGDSCDSGAVQKFEFEKQMILQIELRESIDRRMTPSQRSKNIKTASFAGFSEPVLAEELPKLSVQSKTGGNGRTRSGKQLRTSKMITGNKKNSSSFNNILRP